MATNNLSAQGVVLDLLRNIGVTGFTAPANDQALNQPGLDADDIRRAIAAVNSALQTIQKWGPQSLKYDRRSAYFAIPLAVTLTIAAGAKLATAGVALPATAKGCSILIDGDSSLNRVMNLNVLNTALLRPYMGISGTVNATVYFDCAVLESDVQSVLEPVHGNPGNLRLYASRDIDEFERYRNRCWTWLWGNGSGYVGTVESVTTAIGTPARYYVERGREGIPLLRVAPMPGAIFNVTFQAKLRAERITVSVLDLTGVTDPGYFFTSLHDDEVESLLLPIARQRFFTHPALKNAESRQAVKMEYDEAMLTLRHGQTFEPSVAENRATYI